MDTQAILCTKLPIVLSVFDHGEDGSVLTERTALHNFDIEKVSSSNVGGDVLLGVIDRSFSPGEPRPPGPGLPFGSLESVTASPRSLISKVSQMANSTSAHAHAQETA